MILLLLLQLVPGTFNSNKSWNFRLQGTHIFVFSVPDLPLHPPGKHSEAGSILLSISLLIHVNWKNLLSEADGLPLSAFMALSQIQSNKFILETVDNNVNFLNEFLDY